MRPAPLVAVALAAAACRAPAPAAPPRLEAVEVAGCLDVTDAPSCEIEGRTRLTVFVGAPADAAVVIRVGDRAGAAAWSAADGGWRAHAVVSATTAALEVQAGAARERWAVVHHARAPALLRADALARAGDLAEADRGLARLSTATPRLAGDAASARARLAAQAGDLAAAERHWRAAADLALGAGRRARAANERMSAAFVAQQHGRDLPAARQWIEQAAAELPRRDAAGRANLDFYRGMIAAQLGDAEAALTAFGRASAIAARLDLARVRLAVDQGRSQVLAGLGHYAAAEQLLAPLVAASADRPCDRAWVYVLQTWVALLAMEAGAAPRPELRATAERAQAGLREHCPEPSGLANMSLNLALVALGEGAVAEARRHLAEARALGADGPLEQRLWRLDLEGRAALAAGSATTARARFEALARAADEAGARYASWRADVGRAAALAREGRAQEARAAYAESRRRLRAEALAVGLLSGRAHFLASRRRADQEEIELALAAADPARAIALVRAARAEALRALALPLRVAQLAPEARGRWDAAVARYRAASAALEAEAARAWGAPVAERAAGAARRAELEAERTAALEAALAGAGDLEGPLEPLAAAEGELVLGYFARRGTGADPGDAWLGFAASPAGARVVDLGPIDPRARPAELSRALLAPFDAELARARRVRVLAEGAVDAIDLHALPWRGRPLAAHAALRRSLDAARPPGAHGSGSAPAATAPAPAAPGPWLIVGDPRGDLPAARDEATLLSRQRRAAGAAVELLMGADATRPRVLALLDRAAHLHYAGHGRFVPTATLDSHLPLGGDTALSAGEVLLLPRVPPRVVLSSCESARTLGLGGLQLGLAQAFVLAGAREVIAAARPVDDALARRLAHHLYAAPDAPLDLALQKAQVALAAEDPSADWAAFRAYGP